MAHMLPSQSYSSKAQGRSIRQAFTSLVDSMLYLQRLHELERKREESKEHAESRLIALETLKVDVAEDIAKLKDVLGEARTNELSKQIGGFSTTAVEMMKQKMNQEAQKQLATMDSDYNSEKTRAVKSIEAFLSTSPLSVIDRSIEVTLQDGAYAAKARYRCQDSIEYEFMLDAKVNTFFKGQLRLGVFERNLRIPIGLGRSWLKKEPVPDYRSLEQFVVTYAEATETSLVVESSETEGADRVKLIYSRHGDHASLTLQYSQAAGTIDVTQEPGLNIHLDSDAFIRTMERIWIAMNDLEKRKVAITKIMCENKSLLETLEFSEFFDKCWKATSSSVREAMRLAPQDDPEALDKTFVIEKLKSLGSEANDISEMLQV